MQFHMLIYHRWGTLFYKLYMVLALIKREVSGWIIMKLYMVIAHGLPSCMHILTCRLWHRLRSYDQIRKFRKSSISPKLLDVFQRLIPLCVGLNVCYIFSCKCYYKRCVNEDVMTKIPVSLSHRSEMATDCKSDFTCVKVYQIATFHLLITKTYDQQWAHYVSCFIISLYQ
jgi:hypothetical protein